MDGEDIKNVKYQVYLNERRSLVDAIKEHSVFFDKAILTFSAGAFGLSLTFFKEIVSDIKPNTLEYLFIAWGAFCVSMFCTLFSFITSQKACRRQMERLEKEFCDNEDITNFKNPYDFWTSVLNIFSILFFTTGCVFLIFFGVYNLSNK